MCLKYLNVSYTQDPGGNSPIFFSWGCARLAHKSSSKSAKRDRREARSSELERASESSTCFPCWKSNQVTLFWRELFRVRSCLKGLELSKLLFACLIMGSKPRLFCADQPRLFPSCFTNSRKYMYLLILNVMGLKRTLSYVEGYFRDRLKLKYVKIWSFYLAITLRWCSRTSLYFAFSTHTRLRRSMDA